MVKVIEELQATNNLTYTHFLQKAKDELKEFVDEHPRTIKDGTLENYLNSSLVARPAARSVYVS